MQCTTYSSTDISIIVSKDRLLINTSGCEDKFDCMTELLTTTEYFTVMIVVFDIHDIDTFRKRLE